MQTADVDADTDNKQLPVPIRQLILKDVGEEDAVQKLEQVHPADNNDNPWDKIKKRTAPMVNASVLLLYSVLIAMFIFGWISLNRCTVNRLIPIYLIVAGSTGILTKALMPTRNKYLFNILILLVLFDLLWQAFGSYVVYSAYQPSYEPTNGAPYCHRTAYLLAFWIITLIYALIALFVFLSACYFLMRHTFRKEP